MSKAKSVYICQSCENQVAQWVGQCPSCGEWNTLVETILAGTNSKSSSSVRRTTTLSKPTPLSAFSSEPPKRINSGIQEFDRVLGGGFVPGQVVLLGGEPGVGKSTLLTQIAKKFGDKKVIYVCGEESPEQIRVRAERMEYKADNLYMIPETDTDLVVETIRDFQYSEKNLGLVIIDSIQTITSSEMMGLAGSVGQVRGCAQLLTNLAKSISVPFIIVGHVTKEGSIAGPKVLEHIVDTVLYLEGDEQHMFRILKTAKNRFGPVSEAGIFEMSDAGMIEVANPSELFLSQKLTQSSGSCVTVVMEGFRPILFEVQALTVRTSFGYPRRTTSGINVNRLQLLIAVLEKQCGLNLSTHDVYVNVAGGFKITEYGADLAICMAVASSLLDTAVPDGAVAFGECGLSGEIRRVPHQERRAKEAQKLGYKTILSGESYKSVKQAINGILKSSKADRKT